MSERLMGRAARVESAIGRAEARQVLIDVAALARGRTDPYWSGFFQAAEEVWVRLHHAWGVSGGDFAAKVAAAEALVASGAPRIERPRANEGTPV